MRIIGDEYTFSSSLNKDSVEEHFLEVPSKLNWQNNTHLSSIFEKEFKRAEEESYALPDYFTFNNGLYKCVRNMMYKGEYRRVYVGASKNLKSLVRRHIKFCKKHKLKTTKE